MLDKQKKLLIGEVVSDAMDKTIVVRYTRTFKHDKFHKVVKTSKKYKVHDENNDAKVGDTVSFYLGAPKSKTKYMYLHQVMSAGEKQ